MDLRRGISLALAPRFQSGLAWSDRLEINGGVQVEAGHVYPRRDWRRARDGELTLLAGADRPGPQVRLVTVPPHVRGQWWALGDAGGAPAGADPRYRAFVDDAVAFLRFKQVPLPPRCRMDVVVSRPGQPSTRWDAAAGGPAGLAFNLTAGAAGEHVAGVVNLGDEATRLVLLNLSPRAMAAMLGRRGPGAARPGPDLLRRFAAAMPGYPLIRVRLEAGDGLWLPASGVVYDICTLDKREVDVVLTLVAMAKGDAAGPVRPARL